uniref:NADH-ubiquinone oxidoreductase chain 1 n=1 Tax=Leptaulax koreanus TaxID=2607329 RepID=A0A5C0XKW3_9SCAR|nr:NADH dehydrogenase subunit 1 [Leptaulax koreanus]QEK77363.1 NADH dehydrogenase subunit 1 [Leptaulax koreanus]
MIIFMLEMLLLIVGVLVGIAFLTLMERKVLGYIQIRKGPNKVGFLGLLQPFSDAIKLFTKEIINPFLSNNLIFLIVPFLNLLFSLLVWLIMPYLSMLVSFNLGILFFICLLSLSVYSVMLAGWSSQSNYSLLGAIRGVAQVISYEVSLFLILLSILFLISSLNFMKFVDYQQLMWFIVLCLPLMVVWLITGLAETNRSPFDFAEGESELVSGFNVEYSGGGFAFIFLAEYSSILLMSMVSVIIFVGGNFISWLFFLKLLVLSGFWLWVRGTLPRLRYDKLMYLCWLSILPLTLNLLMFYFGMKLFLNLFY